MGNAQKKLDAREFYNTMSSWRTPDILINPIGTLIYHKNGQWMEGPWVLAFSRAVTDLFPHPFDLRTTLSLPTHRDDAEIWNLVLLQSGISKHFGKPYGLWPDRPPINGILNMEGYAFPPNYRPRVYIDCIPQRMLETLLDRQGKMPDVAIYWRPSGTMIDTMRRFGIPWKDQEDALLDIPEIEFAGQPEDVVAILANHFD